MHRIWCLQKILFEQKIISKKKIKKLLTNEGKIIIINFVVDTTANAQIAQLVEQWTENSCVAGSIPALGIWDISSVGRALDF